jgi:hypothetical protein
VGRRNLKNDKKKISPQAFETIKTSLVYCAHNNNNNNNNNTLQMNPTNSNLNDSVSYTVSPFEDLAYIDDEENEYDEESDESDNRR